MKYRNTVTGAIVDSLCVISGGDWVEIKPEVAIKEKKKESKPKKKK